MLYNVINHFILLLFFFSSSFLLFLVFRPPFEGRVGVPRRPFEGSFDAAPARVARFSSPFAAAVEASSLTDAALRAGALVARCRRAWREGLPVRLRQCSASRAAQDLCGCSSTRDKAAAMRFSSNVTFSRSLALCLCLDRVRSLCLLRPRHDHFA